MDFLKQLISKTKQANTATPKWTKQSDIY